MGGKTIKEGDKAPQKERETMSGLLQKNRQRRGGRENKHKKQERGGTQGQYEKKEFEHEG